MKNYVAMFSTKPVVLVVLEPAMDEVSYTSKYIPLIKKHIDFNIFDVHIIGSYPESKLLKENFSNVHPVIFSPTASRGLRFYLGYMLYLIFAFFKILRLGSRIDSQVIISLGGHSYSGFVAAWASKFLHRRSIIRISEPTRYIVWSRYALGPLISSVIKMLERLTFSLSTVVISNRDMRWYSMDIDKKQVVLSQGVNLSLFNSEAIQNLNSDAFPRLITVARLDKQKNIESVIEAVVLLKNEYPKIQYYIVGSGPDAASLRSKVEELSLNNHVRLYGQAVPEEIPHLLKSCNIFVLASFIEGMPSAVLEAMACGLPVVIASTKFSCQELFKNNENALLVAGIPEDIAKAIRKIVGDNNLRNRLIINGERFVQQFHDSSRTRDRFTEIIQKIVTSML